MSTLSPGAQANLDQRAAHGALVIAALADRVAELLVHQPPMIVAELLATELETDGVGRMDLTATVGYLTVALVKTRTELAEAVRLADVRDKRIDELERDGERTGEEIRELIGELDRLRAVPEIGGTR